MRKDLSIFELEREIENLIEYDNHTDLVNKMLRKQRQGYKYMTLNWETGVYEFFKQISESNSTIRFLDKELLEQCPNLNDVINDIKYGRLMTNISETLAPNKMKLKSIEFDNKLEEIELSRRKIKLLKEITIILKRRNEKIISVIEKFKELE